MGVGFAIIALHQIDYIDIDKAPSHEARPGESVFTEIFPSNRFGKTRILNGSIPTHRIPKVDIIAWRDRIDRKYRVQLGELFDWDEDSTFAAGEDLFSSGLVMLSHVAGLLDQQGPAAALAGVPGPTLDQMRPVEAEANRRGFGGCFPQLLLGAEFWFPFERNLMIEEPDWQERPARYGSAPRLAEELGEIRAFIRGAYPAALAWDSSREWPENDALAAAWQASETVWRLCNLAIQHRVPLSYSG